MKNIQKYKYIILLLLLLMIVLNIISKSKRSSSVTIPESSVKVTEENRTYPSVSDSSAEVTVFTSPETEAQAEIEKPHAIEGISSYDDACNFPGDMVYASQESIGILADIYKKKFALLLEGKVKMYDSDGKESLLHDRYTPMRGYKNAGCEFYFFDMDEDGLPELCVQGVFGTYVCKYDADSNRYTEWWGTTNSGCYIVGTRRIAEDHCGDTERLFLLDKDGYTENPSPITFNISYRPERKYLVSIPDFEDRVNAGEIPDSMKEQVLYDEFWHTYYIRVTEEQYRELISGLREAEKSSKKERVPLSYFFDS